MPDDRRVLEGVGHMIVDGSNVLHALSRAPGALPAAALIGRLRAIVPAEVAVSVILDGSPEHGLHIRRVASGVEVRYSGRDSADELIGRLVQIEGGDPGILVVTDDFDLSTAIHRMGSRTVRTGWLVNRLERQRIAAPAVGRKGLVPPEEAESGREAEGPRWSPGRGATRKRGNPRRGHG